jgi:hypothetical protein
MKSRQTSKKLLRSTPRLAVSAIPKSVVGLFIWLPGHGKYIISFGAINANSAIWRRISLGVLAVAARGGGRTSSIGLEDGRRIVPCNTEERERERVIRGGRGEDFVRGIDRSPALYACPLSWAPIS